MKFNIALRTKERVTLTAVLNSLVGKGGAVKESRDGFLYSHFWLESNRGIDELKQELLEYPIDWFLTDGKRRENSSSEFVNWVREQQPDYRSQFKGETKILECSVSCWGMKLKDAAQCASLQTELRERASNIVGIPLNYTTFVCPSETVQWNGWLNGTGTFSERAGIVSASNLAKALLVVLQKYDSQPQLRISIKYHSQAYTWF